MVAAVSSAATLGSAWLEFVTQACGRVSSGGAFRVTDTVKEKGSGCISVCNRIFQVYVQVNACTNTYGIFSHTSRYRSGGGRGRAQECISPPFVPRLDEFQISEPRSAPSH